MSALDGLKKLQSLNPQSRIQIEVDYLPEAQYDNDRCQAILLVDGVPLSSGMSETPDGAVGVVIENAFQEARQQANAEQAKLEAALVRAKAKQELLK